MLDRPVTDLKGVGEARARLFERLGVRTLRELLYLMPRDYQDYSRLTPVCALEQDAFAAVELLLVSEPMLVRPRGGMQIVSVTGQDDTGKVQLVWYNQPYRKKQFRAGDTLIFCGKADHTHGVKLLNPMAVRALPGLLPVYPLVQGLSQRQVREAVRVALELAAGCCKETLPGAFRAQYRLCERNFALQSLHAPRDWEAVALARRRLAFEDMLYYLLAVGMLRAERAARPGLAFCTEGVRERLCGVLPFAPTAGQLRIMEDIGADMARPLPMNRLVQGDVGSGKTVLALYAMAVALENGYQCAMMAPTEILARQHYALMCRSFGEERCCLLRGGMRKREREAALARVASGEAQAVVGTHALLQEGVAFARLGLVITDEQHRFGVRQRARIADKARVLPGEETLPDVLIMSATPIPRTLSLILYGDLDISVLDELPPGRKPVRTRLVPQEKRADMYAYIAREAAAGRQAYVVCPLVEQSDMLDVRSVQVLYDELCALMPACRLGLLHGRMAAAKKDAVVEAFRAGEVDVLVSTTVVEVGVDVPNAGVMVIEDADRFGLAQLHQLRGRVGRGDAQAYCFLLSRARQGAERLEILTKTHNGFAIAQRDLELRGPGEILGTRQHGLDAFTALRMATGMEVLQDAQSAAALLLAQGETEDFSAVFARAREIYERRMREIAAN